LFQYL